MIALLLTTKFGKKHPFLAFVIGAGLDIFLGFIFAKALMGVL